MSDDDSEGTLLFDDLPLATMGGAHDGQSLADVLREAVRIRDCLALAAVPLVLVAVFLLPVETRRALAFAYHDPTILHAYTAHFVHLRVEHLASNVLGYVLLAGVGYVLAVLAGDRRLFGVATVTYLLAFPLVLSALNLAVPRRALGYGFSGVNMAFAGLLGVVVVEYVGRRLDTRVRARHAPVVFFVAVALVSLVALPPNTVSFALAATSALVAVVYLLYVLRAWRTTDISSVKPTNSRASERSGGWMDIAVLGTLLFFGYPFVGFPAPNVADGMVVNLYVHLLGFSLGFIVPYVAITLGLFDDPTEDF